MACRDAIGILVVDSGAFIKAASLENWSKNVVTIKEVVSEIKDEHTRRRLQVLPYDLDFREPSQEALHHVTTFAKKTGDYQSLSFVDLKLMALAFQLECELGEERGANLRKEPLRTQPAPRRPIVPGVVGFYSGPKTSKDYDGEGEELTADGELVEEEEWSRDSGMEPNQSRDVEQNGDNAVERNGDDAVEWNGDDAVERNRDNAIEWNGDSGEEHNGDSDDSEGWITPENLHAACEAMGGAVKVQAQGIAVGCVTTDFAMQNVMLQMGLNVISVEGMRIKQLRTYAMKCKACFRTTTSTSEVFCPSCGNRTLMKVSVIVDAEGRMGYRPLSKKQLSHRGLKYPLPPPKGGRHADNPILAPDQRITYKERRKRMNKLNPLDPDYVAHSSPFTTKDVTSKGAQIAFSRGGGGRKRNPNAVRSKGKRK